MSIGALCSRVVATAGPDEHVGTVAGRMSEHNVGTAVVVSDGQDPVGIVTDRDLALRVVAPERVPGETTVEQIMSHPVVSLHESTPVEEALARMEGAGIRRLVVVDDEGRLAGILSTDDVLELLAEYVDHMGTILRKNQPRVEEAG